MFTARVFTHSAPRCHLTPQQQDKTDEERSANNRWRGQRRQILQQGALLPCRLTYRCLPRTVHRGALPCMCLTQVLKMFVLLSYEVRSAARSKTAIPALLLSGWLGAPGRGAQPARSPPAESARLSWRATVSPGAPAVGTGTALLLTIVSHRCWRPCGRPRHGPRHRFRATANHGSPASSSQFTALSPDDLRCAERARRDRRQQPACPAAREVRGGGTAVGVTFRLMNGHRVAGSDRPPPAV